MQGIKSVLLKAVSLISALSVSAAAFPVSATAETQSGFNTTLSPFSQWSINNGSWAETANGLFVTSSGDAFALSSVTAENFTLEADVFWPSSSGGAISLMFRATDDFKGYVANIDRGQKNARIFKFDQGGGATTVSSASLSDEILNRTEFNLRVQAYFDELNFYINGNLVISCNDGSFKSGRLGILAYNNNNVVYQNVNHKVINELPNLDSLSLENASFTMPYETGKKSYVAILSKTQNKIRIKATANNTYSIFAEAFNPQGTVSFAKSQIYSGVFSPEIPISHGVNRINCYVRDEYQVENKIEIQILRDYDTSEIYNEKYRPQFHFTPLKNHMNDPNGLVYENGVYHMFYQYNPDGLNFENQHWGHATSTDLVAWKEQPVAIAPDKLGVIFSGSCVVDEENTTGFFSDNTPDQSKLVAIYTSHGGDTSKGTEKQCIAYSKDHGITWEKYEGNPVISNEGNKFGTDFRDPKVIRYNGKWLMIVAGGRARLFSSDNLKNWKHESDLTLKDGSALYSECPDLFPLAVDGNENNIKWVYVGAGKFYIIGDLKLENGKYVFKTQTDKIFPYNGGSEMYATQSYYNDKFSRRLLVSWLQDFTANSLSSYGKTWNGVQSLPLVTELKTINGKLTLTSNPIDEIKSLRGENRSFFAENKTVSPQSENILSSISGEKFDITATFSVKDAKSFGFKLRKGVGQYTTISYDVTRQKLILDKNMSGKATSGSFSMDAPIIGGKVTIRIIVDSSVINAFASQGAAAISTFFFPEPESVGMEFFTLGGNVTIDKMEIYDLKSAYHDDLSSSQTPQRLSLSVPKTDFSVNEEFTVWANITPNSATDKKADFSLELNGVFSVVKTTDNSITLKALKTGRAKLTAVSRTGAKQAEVTLAVTEKNFSTNLEGWTATAGAWSLEPSGYKAKNNNGGDAFAFSNEFAFKGFRYTAQITQPSQGACTGIVFGTADIYSPGSSGWYCFNINTMQGTSKFFINKNGTETYRNEKALSSTLKSKRSFTLSVEVDNEGTAKYFIDKTLIGSYKLPSDYTGGYLGLVSWNSDSTFISANVSYGTTSPVTASVASGKVKAGTKVSLQTDDKDAVIFYSTDDGKTYLKYTSPIEIKGTVTIKAYAHSPKYDDSPVSTFSYSLIEIKNGWINGYYYKNDVLQKNKWVVEKGKTYRTDSKGKMITGTRWITVDRHKYRLSKGVVVCGKIIKIKKSYYILNSKGQLITGKRIYSFKGKKYFIEKNGSIKPDKWTKYKKAWYRSDSKGRLITGKSVYIGKKKFKFAKSGRCLNKS